MRRFASSVALVTAVVTVTTLCLGSPVSRATADTVTTSTGVVTHGGITTTQDTIGWLLTCPLSHRLAQDPIVHPGGAEGSAHLHDFTGNASTFGSSTYASMVAAGNEAANATYNGANAQPGTSCNLPTYGPDGTKADTAAYWRPTLYANGVAVTPTVKDQLYYRAKPTFGTNFVPFPADTRLIVGTHGATSVATNPALVNGNLYWECDGNTSTHYTTAPNCKTSGTFSMLQNVVFPSCYDGQALRHDSAGGTDNNQFAYAVSGVCPTGFPVKVPQLSEKFKYDNIPANAHLQLSSDPGETGLEETYTAHADFWNTWQQVGLQYLVTNCINAQISCGTNPQAPVI